MINVKIEGLDKLQAAFKKSPSIAKEEINKAIKKSLLLIQAKATPFIPVDTGELRNKWLTTFGTLKGTLENTAKHAVFVHEGTKPHFPPISAIERWANRHNIPPFLVAKSISKKGTKAIPFLDDGINKAMNQINSSFDLALTNITNRLAK